MDKVYLQMKVYLQRKVYKQAVQSVQWVTGEEVLDGLPAGEHEIIQPKHC